MNVLGNGWCSEDLGRGWKVVVLCYILYTVSMKELPLTPDLYLVLSQAIKGIVFISGKHSEYTVQLPILKDINLHNFSMVRLDCIT